MHLERHLCESIRGYYPEIGECRTDLDVQLEDDDAGFAISMDGSDRLDLEAWITMDEAIRCLEEGRCASVAVKVLGLLETRERGRAEPGRERSELTSGSRGSSRASSRRR